VSSRRRALDPELTILGGRDFVGLVGRLCREQNWEALTSLFGAVGTASAHHSFSVFDMTTTKEIEGEIDVLDRRVTLATVLFILLGVATGNEVQLDTVTADTLSPISTGPSSRWIATPKPSAPDTVAR